jgi:O-antigen/teichoic acid export membrane protein
MVLIAVLLLGGVLVIPLAGPLTWLTAGPEYMEATKTVGILLASGMVVVATVPIVAMFYSLKNPEYFALSGIVQTIVLVAANYILIPSLGIEGAGFARLISRLSVFLFSLVFAVFSIRKQFRIKVMDEISSVKNILE